MIRTSYRLTPSDLKSRKRKTLIGFYAYRKGTAENRHRIIADLVLENWKPLKAKN